MFGLLRKIFGTSNDRAIRKLRKEIEEVNKLEEEIAVLSDDELKDKTTEFRSRLASGSTLEELLCEAFAVVREASKRTLGMRHFDEQLIGGLILHRGMIAEMGTGEGKTLAATLPSYLNALSDKGVHVVTVNDYLAKRDAEWMGQIYRFLGMSVSCIVHNMSPAERKKAYLSDITYATNNELGFDFLRDNMVFSMEDKTQRRNFVIVDEVDSVLIDEARTPLIISGPVNDNADLYVAIDKVASRLVEDDYEKDEKFKTVNLKEHGINKVEVELQKMELIAKNTGLYDFENMRFVHYVTQSLKAYALFVKDKDYIVQNDMVKIIDEFTGRIMEGRRYSEGLHQALEAKEGVGIQNENQTLASITFQNYFRMYDKIAGMTGTAMTEAAELKDIYKLDVLSVPTHRPNDRKDQNDEIYGTQDEKNQAMLKLVKERHEKGQPILVGTVSIEKSEELSDLFKKHKIEHNVLNAKYHEQEAHIIAQAGRYGSVTIATNMAGRGTDIMLGGNPEMLLKGDLDAMSGELKAQKKKVDVVKKATIAEGKKVIEAGGLLVIGSERHESRRIDNQLRGRSGRQGDPGETKFFLSLGDDLMRIFASERMSNILRSLGLKNGEAIDHPMINRAIEKAQKKVESMHYDMRRGLLKFDDVMSDQRKVVYSQRDEIISATDLSKTFLEMSHEWISDAVKKFIPPESFREQWNLDGLTKEAFRVLNIYLDKNQLSNQDIDEDRLIQEMKGKVQDLYDKKEQSFSEDNMREATRYMLLATLDLVWKEHLHLLDHMKQGISLRAYGNKDPLNEYKKEAFAMFEQMLDNLREMFVGRVSHMQLNLDHIKTEDLLVRKRKLENVFETREDPMFKKYNAGFSAIAKAKKMPAYVEPGNRNPQDSSTWGKIMRNELCPCGSQKKYKHCHGVLK